jgi:hypothetical protein
MEKEIIIFFIFVLLISFVNASCSNNQIDINSASSEELDKIIHVGPTVAGNIINARPFDSLDELVNVSHISENYLNDIKEQGLACVDKDNSVDKNVEIPEEDSETEIQQEKTEDKEEKESKEAVKKEISVVYENDEININHTIPEKQPVIKLNSQTIKSGDEKESSDKNNYAEYGFVAFCALLVFLFILKIRKNKDELEE